MIQESPANATCKTLAITILIIFALSQTISATSDATLEESAILQVTDHRKFLGSASEEKFKIFMKKYDKEYATREEYIHRLGVFAKNIIRAAEHQILDPTAVHGVTPFMDLTEEEFEKMYTGVVGGGGVAQAQGGAVSFLETGGLPASFDWRKKGAVTDVKMQVKNVRKVEVLWFYLFIYFKN